MERKLVLYPRDPEGSVELESVERVLREADFIGRPVEVVDARRFRPGDRFERLVSFVSPGRILEEGKADPKRCTIGIPEVREEIDFLAGSNVRAPSCECGTVFADWTVRVQKWQGDGADWKCDGCGNEAPPWDFDWQRSAGFGRYNVDVHGIDFGEAVPSPELIRTLKEIDGGDWDYFYFVQ